MDDNEKKKWIKKYYFHNIPVCELCKDNTIRPADKTIYCVWTGDNKMSINRKKSLKSMKQNAGVKVILITKKNLHLYIKKDYPLHEAYQYLSETCKSDYLRCYLMHFYGGAYIDIKHIKDNLNKFFDNLNNSDKWINSSQSYKDGTHGNNKSRTLSISPYGVKYNITPYGQYICKPETPITHEWFLLLHQKLDNKLELLKKNPSKDVRDG